MNIRHTFCLIALTVSGLGACLSAPADPQKDSFAVLTHKDPGFTETITLYTDGRYQQEETQSEAKPYRLGSLHQLTLPGIDLPYLSGGSRGGGWRLLDKEGGLPILYKPGENFPADAVVELKSAMPFGFVWDNQSPFNMHSDRCLEAGLFQATKPLPSLVKP